MKQYKNIMQRNLRAVSRQWCFMDSFSAETFATFSIESKQSLTGISIPLTISRFLYEKFFYHLSDLYSSIQNGLFYNLVIIMTTKLMFLLERNYLLLYRTLHYNLVYLTNFSKGLDNEGFSECNRKINQHKNGLKSISALKGFEVLRADLID